MNELTIINNTQVLVKEFSGQRVVTFKDIDAVHGRPDETASRNFRSNREHFIEGEDFFMLDQPDEIRSLGIQRPQFFKKSVDFSSRMNYTKCVTEREVKQCHHAQADPRLKIPRMCASASGSMQKQTVCLTSIVKRKKSTKRKPSGKESICCWENKNNDLLPILQDCQQAVITPKE